MGKSRPAMFWMSVDTSPSDIPNSTSDEEPKDSEAHALTPLSQQPAILGRLVQQLDPDDILLVFELLDDPFDDVLSGVPVGRVGDEIRRTGFSGVFPRVVC
jgi:hypothetical protein